MLSSIRTRTAQRSAHPGFFLLTWYMENAKSSAARKDEGGEMEPVSSLTPFSVVVSAPPSPLSPEARTPRAPVPLTTPSPSSETPVAVHPMARSSQQDMTQARVGWSGRPAYSCDCFYFLGGGGGFHRTFIVLRSLFCSSVANLQILCGLQVSFYATFFAYYQNKYVEWRFGANRVDILLKTKLVDLTQATKMRNCGELNPSPSLE